MTITGDPVADFLLMTVFWYLAFRIIFMLAADL